MRLFTRYWAWRYWVPFISCWNRGINQSMGISWRRVWEGVRGGGEGEVSKWGTRVKKAVGVGDLFNVGSGERDGGRVAWRDKWENISSNAYSSVSASNGHFYYSSKIQHSFFFKAGGRRTRSILLKLQTRMIIDNTFPISNFPSPEFPLYGQNNSFLAGNLVPHNFPLNC